MSNIMEDYRGFWTRLFICLALKALLHFRVKEGAQPLWLLTMRAVTEVGSSEHLLKFG